MTDVASTRALQEITSPAVDTYLQMICAGTASKNGCPVARCIATEPLHADGAGALSL